MIVKKIFFIYLFLIKFVFASDNSDNLFKLGFEFQEGSHLCPWADGENRFQKKPIFTTYKNGKLLWEVVIDTCDIEFVSAPFSNHDETSIEDCIKSITLACDTLKDLNRNNTQFVGSLTFKKWINGEAVLVTSPPEEYTLKIKGLREKLREQNIEITLDPLYFFIEFNSITTKGTDWEPILQPQVTIQHKLESTIHLLLSLFCFGSEYQNDGVSHTLLSTVYEQLVKAEQANGTSAGIRKNLLEALFSIKFKEGSIDHFPTSSSITLPVKTRPIAGLLFLHTFTCLSLVSDSHADHSLSVDKTLGYFIESRQVDAKVSLGVLSRRPFSKMWEDIKNQYNDTFINLYQKRISSIKQEELNGKFALINYAEEYVDDDGKRQDLSHLVTLFTQPSYSLRLLLQHGIISMSMVRQMNLPNSELQNEIKQIFDDYYAVVIQSIDSVSDSFRFNPKTSKIETEKRRVDALSPPFFLSHNDSMGSYKSFIDSSYGEAILEIRDIKNVGDFFLQDKKKWRREFLTNQRKGENNSPLLDQAKHLFLFLKEQLA